MLTKKINKNNVPFYSGKWFLIISAWLLSSAVLISFNYGKVYSDIANALDYREGEVASQDFSLDYTLSFIDKDATDKLKEIKKNLVPPVYSVQKSVTDSVLRNYDDFVNYIESSFFEGTDIKDKENSKFEEIANTIKLNKLSDFRQLNHLLTITGSILRSMMYEGVFDFSSADPFNALKQIELTYTDAPEKHIIVSKDEVITVNNLEEKVSLLPEVSNLNDKEADLVILLLKFFIEPNAYYNPYLTNLNREDIVKSTQPIRITIPAGSRIIKNGDVITSRQVKILQEIKQKRSTGYRWLLMPLISLFFLYLSGFLLFVIFGIKFKNQKDKWMYFIFGAVYFLITAALVSFTDLPDSLKVSVLLPTALFTLLLTQLLQDKSITVVSTFLMSFLVFLLTDFSAFDFIVTLSSGFAGIVVIKRRETRMGLLKAGPRLALIMFLSSYLAGILAKFPSGISLSVSGWSAANGLITGVMSLAFLPLLEHVLNTATTFRLIELSDLNTPILKRMRIQAPGTFNHSQNVANLAEAACEAIGADGLLARVGAYYHDIGKIDKAELYIENQNPGENKHDELKTTLSVAVIKSHVKIGVEKGMELHLPKEVLAIIEQHHGTSVIQYFYNRAVSEKGEENVNIDDYSHTGPKPRSKEAAIVMLADSAEAATRTIKKPTAAKLEKFIWDLIMERFKNGELNETELTLKDLETVKNVFVQVLTGYFHSRIEYRKTRKTDEQH